MEMYNDAIRRHGGDEEAADVYQIEVVKRLDALLKDLEEGGREVYSGKKAGDDAADGGGSSSSSVAESAGFFKGIASMFSSSSAPPSPSSSSSLPFNSLLSPTGPKGLYVHGGVGCGKTFTMDLFHSCVLSSSSLGLGTSQKVHFHQFMLDVHQAMHNAKQSQQRGEAAKGDPLPRVVEGIAAKGKIICFDEFQVTDVADALILRRLFTGLYSLGCVVVSTSNRPPEDLYLNGLQRDLFLPFIDYLKVKNDVVSMWDSEVDYRLVHGLHAAKGVYFVDEGGGEGEQGAGAVFEEAWESAVGGAKVGSKTLRTQGRNVLVPRCAEDKGVARFSFWDLCGKSKGAADYLLIAAAFPTVFLEDVPTLDMSQINVVRRFITLVDALYENECKIVVRAAARPDGLFQVDLEDKNRDEAFAFDRTRSRLEEMMSQEWLKRKRRKDP